MAQISKKISFWQCLDSLKLNLSCFHNWHKKPFKVLYIYAVSYSHLKHFSCSLLLILSNKYQLFFSSASWNILNFTYFLKKMSSQEYTQWFGIILFNSFYQLRFLISSFFLIKKTLTIKWSKLSIKYQKSFWNDKKTRRWSWWFW